MSRTSSDVVPTLIPIDTKDVPVTVHRKISTSFLTPTRAVTFHADIGFPELEIHAIKDRPTLVPP